ncbi:MAG TPA: DUF58 domain-containing protein [Steroidobacteraceae bacterium]|nr:DUF58 domain-containing protein [Steroidobacteraceae bacterium]
MKRFLRNRIAAWAKRRQGPDVPPVELASRRVYILPTPVGIGFAVMLLVMLIAGINYGNSVALFLTFLLTGFGLVTMHQCHRNLVRTSLTSAAALPTFAGTRGTLRVTLQNDASFRRYQIEVEPTDEAPGRADVPPHQQAQLSIAMDAPKRGIVSIDRLRISSTFPFGLFRAWSWIHMRIEMIVYPRAYGAQPMPVDSGTKTGTRSRGLAGSDEWLLLRPFRDGDSPRQVAWKAYARGAPLLVKEYSAMGAELRMFDFAKLEHLDLEARLEQLARWVVDAEARGERYGLAIPPHHFEPDSGPEHRHRCLAALAAYGVQRSANDG